MFINSFIVAPVAAIPKGHQAGHTVYDVGTGGDPEQVTVSSHACTCVPVLCLQASCATMAWLDACAKLLLQQQYSLEQQLSKFTAVIPGQGLVRHSPQRSDYSSHNLPVTPTGGSLSAPLLIQSLPTHTHTHCLGSCSSQAKLLRT